MVLDGERGIVAVKRKLFECCRPHVGLRYKTIVGHDIPINYSNVQQGLARVRWSCDAIGIRPSKCKSKQGVGSRVVALSVRDEEKCQDCSRGQGRNKVREEQQWP